MLKYLYYCNSNILNIKINEFFRKITPDYNRVLQVASGFKCPSSGFVFGWKSTSKGEYWIKVNGTTIGYIVFTGGNYGCVDGSFGAPVKKGDIVTANIEFYFVPNHSE